METFERVEKKYLLSREQYEKFMEMISCRLKDAEYPVSDISSIYYDTDSDELIRRSIEKPLYKEKLRVRSYHVKGREDEVFVELKKKFEGIVYKRRTDVSLQDLLKNGLQHCHYANEQIGKEIRWFDAFYPDLMPKVMISVHRLSYVDKDNDDLRITFDEHTTYRYDDLDFRKGIYGKELFPNGEVIMEIKIPGAMPLYLAEALSLLEIYPHSISKYGTVYTENLKGGQYNERIRNDILTEHDSQRIPDRDRRIPGLGFGRFSVLHV